MSLSIQNGREPFLSKKMPLPSNRSFGFLLAGLLIFLSVYFRYESKDPLIRDGCLISGLLVGLLAMVAPVLLTPFKWVWMRLGELIGKVVNPLMLGVMFFVLITPISLISRIFGRDVLFLKRPNVSSYWIDRTPPGPAGDSFKNQF
jgi:hypothetical protein